MSILSDAHSRKVKVHNIDSANYDSVMGILNTNAPASAKCCSLIISFQTNFKCLLKKNSSNVDEKKKHYFFSKDPQYLCLNLDDKRTRHATFISWHNPFLVFFSVGEGRWAGIVMTCRAHGGCLGWL